MDEAAATLDTNQLSITTHAAIVYDCHRGGEYWRSNDVRVFLGRALTLGEHLGARAEMLLQYQRNCAAQPRHPVLVDRD